MTGDDWDRIAAENLFRRALIEEGRTGADAESGGHDHPAGRTVGAAQFLDHAQRRDGIGLGSAETFR